MIFLTKSKIPQHSYELLYFLLYLLTISYKKNELKYNIFNKFTLWANFTNGNPAQHLTLTVD